jgi:sugar phosphate isomerase/epimerase
MAESQIAAQLYTVRKFTRTPAEIAATLKKVREIGYEAVQCSALGPIEPEELRKLADGEGLTICATHEPFLKFRDEIDSMLEKHRILGCKHPAVGGMAPYDYGVVEDYARFAREANQIGQKLATAGMTFSYHNHNAEFVRLGGRLGMDIIFEDTDPRYVKAELDIYWVQAGGGDPAAWIDKLSNRMPLLHLKDMTIIDHQPTYAEVGEGNLNWPAILDAARRAGVEWYIIEQDVCQRDPFESLGISLENLQEMGVT